MISLPNTARPSGPNGPLDKMVGAIFLALFVCIALAIGAAVFGCTKAQQRTAIHAADQACEIVSLSLADGTATAVCLAWDALSPLLRKIVEARSMGQTALEVDLVGTDGSVRTIRISDLRAAESEVMGAQAKFGARRQ